MIKYSKFSTDYKKSKGRIFNENPDPHRTCFMKIPVMAMEISANFCSFK